VLTFAKKFIDDEHISVGINTFIVAASSSNQLDYHDKRGAVALSIKKSRLNTSLCTLLCKQDIFSCTCT
jgi:hypothetical protein